MNRMDTLLRFMMESIRKLEVDNANLNKKVCFLSEELDRRSIDSREYESKLLDMLMASNGRSVDLSGSNGLNISNENSAVGVGDILAEFSDICKTDLNVLPRSTMEEGETFGIEKSLTTSGKRKKSGINICETGSGKSKMKLDNPWVDKASELGETLRDREASKLVGQVITKPFKENLHGSSLAGRALSSGNRGRLKQISKAFWVKYCDSLSNHVFRKLPCGSTEEAELTKSGDEKEHNIVDIDDFNEDSNSRPNKIRKISSYGNSEAANKTKPVSEANTDHENQGIGTNNNNNKSPSSEAASKFFSDNPHFQVKLRAHQLRGNGKLYIPVAIANSWFEKKTQIVSLWVGEEYWHVNLTVNKGSSSSGLEHRFSSGWRAFARDNSLQPNDVCIFELISKNKLEVKVTIFRQSESNVAQQ